MLIGTIHLNIQRDILFERYFYTSSKKNEKSESRINAFCKRYNPQRHTKMKGGAGEDGIIRRGKKVLTI